ncbi:ATP-binding protein, partial [Aminiphilus sp.]|uniref:ATP-binding protein n=1 Tax=Aminiphilus sp. TaxID=1872488 RepID=UPI002604FEAD
MSRSFCTEGPIDKERNYYVPRTELLAVGLKKVEEWRYFTLTAPRQSGKSTYFQFLAEELLMPGSGILPLWLSFESFWQKTPETFLEAVKIQTDLRLAQYGRSERLSLPKDVDQLAESWRRLSEETGRDLVLVVDEMEGLQNLPLLNAFLHTLRRTYHDRRNYRLRSVILVGVSNITGILQSTASPFNIAEQITIPYFTREET